MPILKLVALIGVIFLGWYGVVQMWGKYGALPAAALLATLVITGKVISKSILKIVKSKISKERE